MANPVDQSLSATHYNYTALPGASAQTTAGHGIDTLYPTDVYGRLVAVSAAPTLCMSNCQCIVRWKVSYVMNMPKICSYSTVYAFAKVLIIII